MAMIVSASGNHSVSFTIVNKTMHKETPWFNVFFCIDFSCFSFA